MILLTKENCGQCDDFKNFLSFTTLGKKHGDKIEILVKEEANPINFEVWLELAKLQGATSFPILLNDDSKLLMSGFNATKVVGIFKDL